MMSKGFPLGLRGKRGCLEVSDSLWVIWCIIPGIWGRLLVLFNSDLFGSLC